jgi:hypothetical protein
MPWREIIFTDAGAVFPASWDMNKYNPEKVASTVPKKLSDASSLLDQRNFQFPSFADFADDGDSTSEASIWVGNSGSDLNAPEVLKTKAETVG